MGKPRHRFMSAFEQKVEAPDSKFQYLMFACEPYETIAFKVPNMEVDKDGSKFYSNWDKSRKVFTMQISSKSARIRNSPRCRRSRVPRTLLFTVVEAWCAKHRRGLHRLPEGQLQTYSCMRVPSACALSATVALAGANVSAHWRKI